MPAGELFLYSEAGVESLHLEPESQSNRVVDLDARLERLRSQRGWLFQLPDTEGKRMSKTMEGLKLFYYIYILMYYVSTELITRTQP